ncbi:nuclease-related domain-containing DEAD/DEAH box helicase [Microbacterium lacusdiani]
MPPHMIPARPRKGANGSERRVFDAFASVRGHDDWIVIHSLQLRRHATQFQGEADFLVLVPGRGIVVIEAKSPEYVSYRDGEWMLDRVPNPGKSPFDQVDGAIRSLRGFLARREILVGSEPIARLVWFTSLGRHQFETHGDMQFFEWELAFRDDLRRPEALIEKVLAEHDAWYRTVDGVAHDPAVMTGDHVSTIARALLGDLEGGRTLADRKLERLDDEQRLLKSQARILDAVARNDRIYFEGPAGTGKSHLVMSAAKRHAGQGARVLAACWNELMADALRERLGRHAAIHATSLNALMLRIAGLEANRVDADNAWYTERLPQLAIEAFRAAPDRHAYDVVCIDEFQDVAGLPGVLAFLDELVADDAKLVLAGDRRQQILRPSTTHVDPFAVAREHFPGLMHVSVDQGVRQVAALASGAEELLSRRFGYSSHRLVTNDPGALSIVPVGTDNAGAELARSLRELLEHHQAHDVVILSPFGERHSLVGRLLAAQNFTKDEKWLRAQLRPLVGAADGDAHGRVRWGSIGKFKGLDAEAVILTDVGDAGIAFAWEHGLSWFDLLYVGLTRARYRCVVVAG